MTHSRSLTLDATYHRMVDEHAALAGSETIYSVYDGTTYLGATDNLSSLETYTTLPGTIIFECRPAEKCSFRIF